MSIETRIPGRLRPSYRVLSETVHEWQRHKASRLAAALSYYTVFALAPLLVVVIAVVGFFVGQGAAKQNLVGQVSSQLGVSRSFIDSLLTNAGSHGAGIVATVLGMIFVILGAAGVFRSLKDSLNTLWELPDKGGGITGFLRSNLLSFAMVLAIGFLLLVSLVLTAAIGIVAGRVSSVIPMPGLLLQLANVLLSLAVVTVLFGLIFRVLPDTEIPWGDVWLGAFVTAVLFTIGKFLIGLYLGHSGSAAAFGGAAALALLLLWIYYSAQIFLFGAQFTQVYACRYGSYSGICKGQAPEGSLGQKAA